MQDLIFITHQKDKKFKLHVRTKNEDVLYIFKNVKNTCQYLHKQKIIKESLPIIKDYITNFELDKNKELVNDILKCSKKMKPILQQDNINYYKISLYYYHHINEKNIMQVGGYYYMSVLNENIITFLRNREFTKIQNNK